MRKQNKKLLAQSCRKKKRRKLSFLCARRDQVYKTYISKDGEKEFSSKPKPVLSATD